MDLAERAACGPAAGQPRIAVLVLGMHRSGTSFVTRLLSLMGCDLPRTLIGERPSNPRGHWESEPIQMLNDRLLAAAESRWDDWRPLGGGPAGPWAGDPGAGLGAGVNGGPDAGPDVELAAGLAAEARALLASEFAASPLMVLKDPRLCRLLPFWLGVLGAEGIEARPLLVLRNPLEVAASLRQRDGMAPGVAHLLWLRHTLDAERATRGHRRALVEYGAMLDDWRGGVEAAGRALGLVWPRPAAAAADDVDAFLARELRHHRHTPEEVTQDPSLPAWLREAYALLHGWAAAGEAEGDRARLDVLRARLDEGAAAFGPAALAERELRGRLATQLRRSLEAVAARLRQAEDDHEARLTQEAARLRAAAERSAGEAARAAVEAAALRAEAQAQRAEAQALRDRLAEAEIELERARRRVEEERCQGAEAERDLAQARLALGRLRDEAERRLAELRRLVDALEATRPRHWEPGALALARRVAAVRAAGVLDARWYLSTYADVDQAGLDPVRHFVQHGLREGRAPNRRWTLALDAPPPAVPAVPTPAGEASARPAAALGLRGALDLSPRRPAIMGWLARVGDPAPRAALLRVGPLSLTVSAAEFRADLQEKGIGQGRHGFSLPLPIEIMDGRERELVLVDAATGAEVARRSCAWAPPQPDWTDFEGYLQSSMTQPLVLAPFVEEHKRAFAVMEAVGSRLAARGLALAERPLVSVVMPVFNREGVVGEAIASVRAQLWDRWELIVVDDGSADQSAEEVAAQAAQDPRIRLVRLPENRGHSVARNRGLAAGAGSIIAYLDSDNRWDPRYLAAVVGTFADEPAADALYTAQYIWRGQAAAPQAVRYAHFHRALLENRNFVDLNCFAHRRGLLARMGGFDEGLRRFVDYDLVLRAAEAGRLVSVPALLSHYVYDRVADTVSNDRRHEDHLRLVHQRRAERRRQRLEALGRRPLDRPVSVVIPNWEALAELRDCLDALAAQDPGGGLLEVVVADNASSAPVRAELEARRAAGRIVHLPLGRNFGFTHAANEGIRAARPEADILLLNNDAILEPGALAALARAAHELPGAGMVVPRQILPAGTKTLRNHVPFALEDGDCDVNISAHHRNLGPLPLIHDGGPVELTYAPFFAVYIRRDLIDAIGLLDAEFGRHYRSDRTYCDLARTVAGRRLWYVPEAEVVHRLQRATDTLRDRQDAEWETMFRQNRWDEATAAGLGFRRALWDL
jgi:glycosyltransferase involved in cell wall biosynthesis